MKFFNKKTIYIGLFATLYLIVAFSSFYHAVAFFGLANNSWMSVILAFAFEIGQAAVLFSLLTSQKDRSRIMPWVLMFMFTLVQVIGNVFSSYKYLITNSVENLRYFKEPIFIWTDLPDDQTTVIITYIVGAILPIAALLLTSMITNYLNDNEEENKQENQSGILGDYSILQMENQGLKEQIDKLKNQLQKEEEESRENAKYEAVEQIIPKDDDKNQQEDQTVEIEENTTRNENNSEIEEDIENVEDNSKPSHFVNLG